MNMQLMMARARMNHQPASGGVPWSQVVALLHFEGSNGSTSITDETGRTWTTGGNAKISTGWSKFGLSSLYLDGSGDYIRASNPSLWSVDFTIEGFIKPDRVNVFQVLFTTYNNPSQAKTALLAINPDGTLSGGNGLANAYSSPVLVAGGEYFVQLKYTASSQTIQVTLDGALIASVASLEISNGADLFFGGSPGDNNIGTFWYQGFLDEWRISKALAPAAIPTSPFPNS